MQFLESPHEHAGHMPQVVIQRKADSGRRSRSVSRAMRVSRRASGAPTQRWMPLAKSEMRLQVGPAWIKPLGIRELFVVAIA